MPIQYLIIPMASAALSEVLCLLIHYYSNIDQPYVLIILLIITIFFIVLTLYVITALYNCTIIFKPTSLMSFVPQTQFSVFLNTILITVLTSVGGYLSEIPQIIFLALSAVLYVGSIFLFQESGGFVSHMFEKCLGTSCIFGVISLIYIIISLLISFPAHDAFFVAIFVVWFGIFVIYSIYMKKKMTNVGLFFDNIQEYPDAINEIKRPKEFINKTILGFRIGHPLCLSYSIFKYGVEKWPKDMSIWLLYSKMAAIYPEKNQELIFIAIGINKSHLRGNLAYNTQVQIQSIARQREASLVPDLKKKLDKISKHIQETKHKVRYVWDLILQGNVKELESVIVRSYSTIDETQTEFLRLLRQFPNNKFVGRSYGRFLRDVMADHEGYKEWVQKFQLLQKGIPVTIDLPHQLGLHAFPMLPKKLEVGKPSNQGFGNTSIEEQFTIEVDSSDGGLEMEMKSTIRDSIDFLVIPSFRNAIPLRIIPFIILFLASIITFTIYSRGYVNSVTEPLEHMYTLSNLRNKLFQITAITHHYIVEKLNKVYTDDPNDPDYIENEVGKVVFPFVSPEQYQYENGIEVETSEHLGGHNSSKLQIDYLAQQITSLVSNLSYLLDYNTGDEVIEGVKSDIFDNRFNMTVVSDSIIEDCWNDHLIDDSCMTPGKVTYQLTSLREATLDFVVNIRNIISMENIPQYIFLMKDSNFILANLNNIIQNYEKSMNDFLTFINSFEQRMTLIISIIVYCLIVIVLICYIVLAIYIETSMNKDKKLIYKALASLPKNVVSKVSDSFKVLKKEDDSKYSRSKDEELSRQEENLLKIFSTSSDANSHECGDIVSMIIVTILIIILNISFLAYTLYLYENLANTLMQTAPHVNYIIGSYSYSIGEVLMLNMLPGLIHPSRAFNLLNYDINTTIEQLKDWEEMSMDYYRTVHYGDLTTNTKSFTSINIDINITEVEHVSIMPSTQHEIYEYMSTDLLISYVRIEINRLVAMYVENNDIIEGNDPTLSNIWHYLQDHLFKDYYSFMFEGIYNNVYEELNSRTSPYLIVSYIILVLGIIIELILIITIKNSEKKQKFALKLLLHIPSNDVISNPQISMILSGNFKKNKFNSTNRDSTFYDKILEEMPDCIIISDISGIILTANKVTKRILELDNTEMIGKNIRELKLHFNEGNPFDNLPTDKYSLEKLNTEKSYSLKISDGTIIHVEITLRFMNESLITVIRDITDTVRYNTLISDEKAKSDHLLSLILPPTLVHRVQSGEKNISFGVQSVSITFMDIVSFTPWCSSLPAATVMNTLNIMFGEFDALVGTYPTMTKIKCIGDCYMAAGGIFAEVNQPAVHAHEVVDFGLEAINAVKKVNEQINQNLRIRVGVNTGGPIVAGVLGTGKPTFEILGPTINIAQQMEHHGVPMKVHISRAVYELIYGAKFEIKERAEMEIQGKNMVTYLVEGKKT